MNPLSQKTMQAKQIKTHWQDRTKQFNLLDQTLLYIIGESIQAAHNQCSTLSLPIFQAAYNQFSKISIQTFQAHNQFSRTYHHQFIFLQLSSERQLLPVIRATGNELRQQQLLQQLLQQQLLQQTHQQLPPL
jgi:hypothetical protein